MRGRSLAVLAMVVAACGGTDGGRVELSWTGADTGRVVFPAHAEWCATDTVLQIIGESGDSGVAIAVFPVDSLVPGTYPVTVPTRRRPRPSARAGVRWFGETLVEGYYGLSGVVEVDSGAGLGGTLEATLKSVTDGGQLSVSGRFLDLAIAAGTTAQCGGGPPAGPDTMVR